MNLIQLGVLAIFCGIYVAAQNYSPEPPPTFNEVEFCDSLSKAIMCFRSNLKYRRINGVCNNLRRPYLGAANTRLIREWKARYADGFFAPPKSITGADLPSARLISLKIFDDKRKSDLKLTVASMQFGQFVAHDLAHSLDSNVTANECCSRDGKIAANINPKCMFIPIASDDPLHGNKSCLNFIRDFVHTDARCLEKPICGPADQLNRVTSYLDLSVVYGNNREQLALVRSFVDGKLTTQTINGQQFPPENPNSRCPPIPNVPQHCPLTGDQRSNLVPQLTIFHILFIREHNRVADALKKLHPTWSDETLFQEARRICIAEYQYIVYYEWLPEILGLDHLINEGIYFRSSGTSYARDYDENIDPSVINEFTAGAFRFFHTQIEGQIQLVDEHRKIVQTTRLSDLFLKPALLTQGSNFQTQCRGMTHQAAQSMDRNYDAEIRSFFVRGNNPVGVDLKAIDIQRDRDHGLPSYNEMRKFAGLKKAHKWDDFSDYISRDDIRRLRSVYASVNDVDLSVGGALERSLDSTVGHGPTYHYLLKTQFYNTRAGDRLWFEFNDSSGAFTPSQLREIRKSSLSRIICDNGGGITKMQKNVFILPTGKNCVTECCDLPVVNLSLWKK